MGPETTIAEHRETALEILDELRVAACALVDAGTKILSEQDHRCHTEAKRRAAWGAAMGAEEFIKAVAADLGVPADIPWHEDGAADE